MQCRQRRILIPLLTMILTGIARLPDEDILSAWYVVLLALAIITFGSSIINGASLLMLQSAAGADPAGFPQLAEIWFSADCIIGALSVSFTSPSCSGQISSNS